MCVMYFLYVCIYNSGFVVFYPEFRTQTVYNVKHCHILTRRLVAFKIHYSVDYSHAVYYDCVQSWLCCQYELMYKNTHWWDKISYVYYIYYWLFIFHLLIHTYLSMFVLYSFYERSESWGVISLSQLGEKGAEENVDTHFVSGSGSRFARPLSRKNSDGNFCEEKIREEKKERSIAPLSLSNSFVPVFLAPVVPLVSPCLRTPHLLDTHSLLYL